MAMSIVKPRIRGFICTTAHPGGCDSNVQAQIDVARAVRKKRAGRLRVLVIGSSTGYGLAARIAAAAMYGADTAGVFFEREGQSCHHHSSHECSLLVLCKGYLSSDPLGNLVFYLGGSPPPNYRVKQESHRSKEDN